MKQLTAVLSWLGKGGDTICCALGWVRHQPWACSRKQTTIWEVSTAQEKFHLSGHYFSHGGRAPGIEHVGPEERVSSAPLFYLSSHQYRTFQRSLSGVLCLFVLFVCFTLPHLLSLADLTDLKLISYGLSLLHPGITGMHHLVRLPFPFWSLVMIAVPIP